MKTNLRRSTFLLGSLAVLTAMVGSTARAQYFTDPGVVYGEAAPAQPQAFASAVPLHSLEGPVWVGYTPTSDGLGYRDGYTSLGGLMPIWGVSGEDLWFFEGQGHISDQGGMFSNVGFGRRIYEHSLRRSFGWSLWYDYDGDEYDNFGHTFHQGGISFESYGDHVDLHFNGYIPFRDGYVLGDGTPCFIDNRIILNQAVDAALRGMDAEVGVRIPWLQMLDLRGYIGGYSYTSEAVDPFLGLSTRLESHPAEYVSMQLRVTEDERFGTNFMFGFELHLGGRRHRNAYERMTEPVHRNDHIVRFHEDPQFAINPVTGQPYNVVHVDNSAPFLGSGTVDLPYSQLAFAQQNSAANDVILVSGRSDSNGNPIPYSDGIVLKDGQQLIGAGSTLVLRNGFLVALNPPTSLATSIQNNPTFIAGGSIPITNTTGTSIGVLSAADTILPTDIVICDISGDKPTIINPAGPAVTLANNNTVAGLTLTGSQWGIFGNGVTNFNINNNMISNNVRGGIEIQNAAGVGIVRNNMIIDNNRPNPPVVPNQPFADGLEVTVSGASSLDLQIAGNQIDDNDTGVRLTSTTSGLVNVNMVDNFINQNVNDGVNILQAGPGTMIATIRGTVTPVEANTGNPPLTPGVVPTPIIIPPAQISRNGSLDKVVDTNGNGRGVFADVLDGNFAMSVDNVVLQNNDSSFFPRYGALQFNLEPGVDSAFVSLTNNTITGTGLHGVDQTGVLDGFVGAGDGIRIVTNPGLGVTHQFEIVGNDIINNFGAGIELLMLTEGLRTAAIPQGTVVASIRSNTIVGNIGILDDSGTQLFGGLANSAGTDIIDDWDSPGNAPPFPVGLFSNPDLKNEFFENINGSGIIVRAKGTDDSRLLLGILDNTIQNNWFDAINIALAGRGNIDFVPSPTPPPPGVVPPVPLTPVRVYQPVIFDPVTNFPIASALSPDTFGVDATIVIDNNRLGDATLTGGTTGNFDDAIKVTMLDGAKAQMRISNNLFVAGNTQPTSPALPAGVDLVGGRNPISIPLNIRNAPGVDNQYNTAIEIDTWDTTRLALVIDNNDITAPRGAVGVTAPHWRDSGIAIGSHENSILATRITRNRINEVLDGNTDFTDLFTVRPTPLSGAGINLLAEGNSTMVAFVNNNDMENRNMVNDTTPPSTGNVNTDAYFEATSADNATLCLQLLDNTAEDGNSPQLSHTINLANDAFYLIQTENSVFELEPTRATNHERALQESLSVTTAVLAYVGSPLDVLPTSDMVQFGNVPSGTCEIRLRELAPFGFPFEESFPGLFNFDPPVIHP
jgi:hypothetical protein